MELLNILPQLDSLPKPDTLNAIQAEIVSMVEKITTTPTTELLKDIVDSGVSFGLKLLAAFLIYFIGAWLIRRIKTILKRMLERRSADAAISSFVQSIVSITLTIILIIITIGTVGIDTSSIAALLTGGGIAIGLALNGTMQNFAGGLMILVFKPFKAGDFIEAQGHSGTVAEVNITSTKLTTTDNRVIIIPNGILSNDVINNYSGRQMRRLDINISVEYGSSAEETKDILLGIIKDDPRVLYIETGAPADPFVALSALNDSGVEFTMRVWVKSENYWPLKFDMNELIYKILPEHGIQFPFPQLDVNIKNIKN
jgi:small conductance mechanosensitive channel